MHSGYTESRTFSRSRRLSHRLLLSITATAGSNSDLSDCQDTTRQKPVEMRSDTTVFVVNGSGSLGVLADVQPKPKQLEAMSAALEAIKTEVRR